MRKKSEIRNPKSELAALREFIAGAADRELYRANPRYLADRLGLDERAMLTLLIAAVSEGLFDLGWQVTCPACDKVGTAQSIGGVERLHRCDNCDHDFEAHLDEEISVTASVNQTVRRLSPARRDDPGFRAEVDARLGPVPALTLINVPTFRYLLVDQVLPEGQSLGVKRLAIFFSDLRCSTAFYHKFGDAEAYRWVCEHFRIMFDAVARHKGTAVKTIGDGVMGVFARPGEALGGIADVMEALAALNARAGLTGDDRLVLKVGMHVGPCIVVTLNGRLDYFGETVNIAARLSKLASGDDVILSDAVLADDAASSLAREVGDLAPLAAELRGLPGCHELHRLVVTPPGGPRPVLSLSKGRAFERLERPSPGAVWRPEDGPSSLELRGV